MIAKAGGKEKTKQTIERQRPTARKRRLGRQQNKATQRTKTLLITKAGEGEEQRALASTKKSLMTSNKKTTSGSRCKKGREKEKRTIKRSV